MSDVRDLADDIRAFATGWTRCRGEQEGVRDLGGVIRAHFPRFGLAAGRDRELLGPTRESAALLTHAASPEGRDAWLALFGDEGPSADLQAAGYVAFRRDWLMTCEKLFAWPGDRAERLSAENLQTLSDEDRAGMHPAFFDEPSFRLAGVRSDQGLAAVGRAAAGDARTLVIDTMKTHPDRRRQGLGGRVLRTLIAGGVDYGLSRACLVATDDGRALYERFGFSVVASCVCYRRSDRGAERPAD